MIHLNPHCMGAALRQLLNPRQPNSEKTRAHNQAQRRARFATYGDSPSALRRRDRRAGLKPRAERQAEAAAKFASVQTQRPL